MQLEDLILKFCGSMDNLAAALNNSNSGSSSGAEKPADAPRRGRPPKDAASGPTHDDALAVAKKLAAAKGAATVHKLVERQAGSGNKKVAELPKDKIAAFIAAAEVLLNEKDESDDEDEDEI